MNRAEFDAAVERLIDQAEQQGFPRRVSDEAVLDRIAGIVVTANAANADGKGRSPSRRSGGNGEDRDESNAKRTGRRRRDGVARGDVAERLDSINVAVPARMDRHMQAPVHSASAEQAAPARIVERSKHDQGKVTS
jgi:hypothetical protein